MFCPNCGSSVEGTVCPCCGAVLGGSAQTTILSQANNPFADAQPQQAYDAGQTVPDQGYAQAGQAFPGQTYAQGGQGFPLNQGYAQAGQPSAQGFAQPLQQQYAPQGAAQPGQYASQGYAQPSQGQPGAGPQGFVQPQFGGPPGFAVPGQAAAFVPQGTPTYAAGQEPPAVGIVRKLGGSPLMLLANLVKTAQLALLVFISFWIQRVLKNVFTYATIDPLLESDATGASGSSGGIPIGTAVLLGLAALLLVLMLISLWSVYISALRRGKRRMSTSGLTTIGAILTLLLWAAILSLAGAFLYFLYLAFTYDLESAAAMVRALLEDYGYGLLSTLLGMDGFDLILLLYAGVSALVILLYASLVKTVNTVKSVVTTGTPDGRGSLAAGILCFLLAAGFGILSVTPLREELYLLAAVPLTEALCDLLFGILCLRWRFRMSRVSAYNV